jgi:hypothetical protein
MYVGFEADPESLEAGSRQMGRHAEQCQAVPRHLEQLGLGGSWGTDVLIAPFVMTFAKCVQAAVRTLSVHGAALDVIGGGLGDTAATMRNADTDTGSAMSTPGAAS